MIQPGQARRVGPPGPQLGAGGPGAVARSAAALIRESGNSATDAETNAETI